MEYFIYKDHHYARPFPWPKFTLKSQWSKTIKVRFSDLARYFIGTDQSDINKLFGISYGHHHTNSDRIGWRYDINKNMIEIMIYSYINKERQSQHLRHVSIGEEVIISISTSTSSDSRDVMFTCGNSKLEKTYPISGWFHKLKYTLGLYFGGNRTAPHDISIDITEI